MAASAIKASIVAPAASSKSWPWHASRSCRKRTTSAEADSAAGSCSRSWQCLLAKHLQSGPQSLDRGVGLLPLLLLLLPLRLQELGFF